jgi:hypothetical protein
MALKKGVTRFEKKNKKRAEESSSARSNERGGGANGMDASRKGETEQMWEHILTS